MEIDNAQKEKPRDKHFEYYIVRFDPFQKLMQGELLSYQAHTILKGKHLFLSTKESIKRG